MSHHELREPTHGRAAPPPSPRWKIAFDRTLALILLVPALPTVAGLWLLVKATSKGPGFHRQVRVGRHGAPFVMFKLRTMRDGCEHLTGPVWAQKDDDRVTLVGTALRRTHLDELPQLFNVLRGDMSLVGPRPERPEIVPLLCQHIDSYPRRLDARPGVTGLAQLHFDGDQSVEDVRRKLEYDLRYLGASSLVLDAKIVCYTVLKLVGLDMPALRRALFLTLTDR